MNQSRATFRGLLAEKLHDLGYSPSKSDPDVGIIPADKAGGFMYYYYVIFYVDGVLCISDDVLCTMKVIQAKFKLKRHKLQEPDIYLGAELSKITNVDDQYCWAMSSDK